MKTTRNYNKTQTELSRTFAEEEQNKGFHRASYHRHFEGYAEFKTIDENGALHIQRVYVGNWYSPQLSKSGHALRKILYPLLWAACTALLLFSASRPITVNTLWYLTSLQALTLVALAWIASALFNYALVPFRQTVGEWRGSGRRLIHSAFTCAGLQSLSFVVQFVALFSHLDSLAASMPSMIGTVCTVILLLSIALMERHVIYTQTPNEQSAPKHAIVIE